MKKEIHPKYHEKAIITCACGAKFEVGSTAEAIEVDICSNCHPFYTGKQKLVDTARRVEKFEEKMAKQTSAASSRKGKTAKKAALKEKRKTKVAVRKTETKKLGGRKKTASAKKETESKKESPASSSDDK